jgi:formamidopyrimidine-DNA glycosylase
MAKGQRKEKLKYNSLLFYLKKKKERKRKEMPEGPEVRIIAESLNNQIVGKKIKDIQVYDTYNKGVQNLSSFLTYNRIGDGTTAVLNVKCKGKFIYFTLANGFYIFNGLGMTGRWSWQETSHSRVKLIFSDKSCLYFEDMRMFGSLHLFHGEQKLTSRLNKLGPDMFYCDQETFLSVLEKKGKARTLPKVLMKQEWLSGIGNYVKSEALYRAKISPTRVIPNVTLGERIELYKAIREVMNESYHSHGLTIRDYVGGLDPESGSFTCQVYGQDADPLGNKVYKVETDDKRITHWVPNVQL